MEERQIADINKIDETHQYKNGMISALGCSLWWGIMPIYWQWLRPIDSVVIIFYRIVLVAIVCFLFALKVHGMEEIKSQLKPKGVKLRYFFGRTFNYCELVHLYLGSQCGLCNSDLYRLLY